MKNEKKEEDKESIVTMNIAGLISCRKESCEIKIPLVSVYLHFTSSVPMLVWSACTSKIPALNIEKRGKLQKITRSLPHYVWLNSGLSYM